jgi:predicted RNA binding protein YcfA (HicA-like mRNA interferase family)
MHPKRKQNPKAKRPKVKGDLDDLVAAAWSAGWWCERKGGSHVMCYAPSGGSRVLVSGTSGDHRAYYKSRSQFRRAGLDV